MNTRLCHQAFQVSSEDYDKALESFKEHGVRVAEEEYRKTGTFTGRSFYFFDPTGNRLEINDPNPPYPSVTNSASSPGDARDVCR